MKKMIWCIKKRRKTRLLAPIRVKNVQHKTVLVSQQESYAPHFVPAITFVSTFSKVATARTNAQSNVGVSKIIVTVTPLSAATVQIA
jgi:hypothetical protein